MRSNLNHINLAKYFTPKNMGTIFKQNTKKHNLNPKSKSWFSGTELKRGSSETFKST